MPERIQLRRAKGWRLPEGAVSVARPGLFGNPWVPGDPGVVWLDRQSGTRVRLPCALSRAGAVDRFRRWLAGEFGDVSGADHPLYGMVLVPDGRRQILDRLPELRGRPLACWCPLDGGPCHANVLLEIANR